jgi:hypothetical protein
MTNFLRIILAIASLLTWLACAVCSIWALATLQPFGLGAVAGLAAFTVLLYNDYQYFFGKKVN